jgi:hypothetical protein
MALNMREHTPGRPKAPREAHSSVSPTDWTASGSGGPMECVFAPSHGIANSSMMRFDCSQHAEDRDPEHPLESPHPTD